MYAPNIYWFARPARFTMFQQQAPAPQEDTRGAPSSSSSSNNGEDMPVLLSVFDKNLSMTNSSSTTSSSIEPTNDASFSITVEVADDPLEVQSHRSPRSFERQMSADGPKRTPSFNDLISNFLDRETEERTDRFDVLAKHEQQLRRRSSSASLGLLGTGDDELEFSQHTPDTIDWRIDARTIPAVADK
jgi:hypothetical protein